jgi:hypothetical protein
MNLEGREVSFRPWTKPYCRPGDRIVARSRKPEPGGRDAGG